MKYKNIEKKMKFPKKSMLIFFKMCYTTIDICRKSKYET